MPETMISAAEKLRADILKGEFDEELFSIGLDDPERYKALACAILRQYRIIITVQLRS